jgi:hypothetical protein
MSEINEKALDKAIGGLDYAVAYNLDSRKTCREIIRRYETAKPQPPQSEVDKAVSDAVHLGIGFTRVTEDGIKHLGYNDVYKEPAKDHKELIERADAVLGEFAATKINYTTPGDGVDSGEIFHYACSLEALVRDLKAALCKPAPDSGLREALKESVLTAERNLDSYRRNLEALETAYNLAKEGTHDQ